MEGGERSEMRIWRGGEKGKLAEKQAKERGGFCYSERKGSEEPQMATPGWPDEYNNRHVILLLHVTTEYYKIKGICLLTADSTAQHSTAQ
jgi:hypothetical protein